MGCTVTAPRGANGNCTNYMSEAVAAIITTPDFSLSSIGEVDNIENFRVLLQESRKGFIIEFNGVESTAAEAVDETTGYGQTITTAINAPSLTGYMKTNPCDFVEVLDALNGGTYRVYFVLADGGILMVDNLQARTPSLRGFETQIFAINIGIPGRENQVQEYKIKMNFLSTKEFRKYKMVSTHYDYSDLMELLPLGLQADINTAFDGSDVVVDVYTRCVPDDETTDTLTAEVESCTLGLTPGLIVTNNGEGNYSIAVTSDGTTPLATGEYVRFYLTLKDGDIYDAISNVIEVEA